MPAIIHSTVTALSDLSPDTAALVGALRRINGRRNVRTGSATAAYCAGYRFGGGVVAAVATPRSLVAFWRTLQHCVDTDTIVIVQAANTGLTGGSTPAGADYERPIVLISTLAMDTIHVIDGGRQVICLPGATLHQLERRLARIGRAPHSVIGSSCIGASVVGGICNSSGGALVRRGPAYTELALYAQRSAEGELRLVNHLEVVLGDDPEVALRELEDGRFKLREDTSDRRASDRSYATRVRDIADPTPARYNADPSRLFEASGSAGKLAIFAVRLDTFPTDDRTATFYLGTNEPDALTEIRRTILRDFDSLPVSGEYLHRDCFDMAHDYGKDMFLAIKMLGTTRLPQVFAAKAWVERWSQRFGFRAGGTERWLQRLSKWLPEHLPVRIRDFRKHFDHHLILTMAGSGIEEAEALVERTLHGTAGAFFRCSKREAEAAFLHRFVAAGAAVRYRSVHATHVEDIIALDIALPRDATGWSETLPADVDSALLHKLYYGHFFCHVFHQDYLVRKGADVSALERRMCALLDNRGAEYPAEHNVGHHYPAKPALAEFYRSLDPQNRMNPGIGQLSRARDWR